MPITSFGIEKEFLRDLLAEVDSGTLQLPEFQRGWVWPVENITSLVASIPPGVYNSVLNKTPLAARTNRVIGGQAPSVYLPRLAVNAQADPTKVAENIATHLADVQCLERNDFESFVEDRRGRLLDKIGAYMGKDLLPGLAAPDVDEVSDVDEDEDE